jgi:hypothetical protein
MEEQYQTPNAAMPLKNQGMLKMILMNIIVSALISLIVSYIVVMAAAGPLTNQVQVLQAQMAKQMKAYHTN